MSTYTQEDFDLLVHTIREWDQPGSTSRPDHETPTEQWKQFAKMLLESDWRKEHDRWLLRFYTEHSADVMEANK